MNKLILSVILLAILVCIYWYQSTSSAYVKSTIDNNYYLVRDLPDKQEVADSLATIKRNIDLLTAHMLANAPKEFKPYMERLEQKIKTVVIVENIRDFYYTSYSVNKGERLVFCMRSRNKQTNNKKHDINLMMYVVLHEISNIACPEYDHTQLFKQIFKYVTESAIGLNIYYPIDFKNTPTEYCGMTITDSIV